MSGGKKKEQIQQSHCMTDLLDHI